MPLLDKAKDIIERKKELFTVLEELDRTGTFRKPVYKTRATFTIDEDLFSRFRSYCKKNSINMSAKVEQLLKEFIGKSS